MRTLMEDDPGKAYSNLKKLTTQPEDDLEGGNFTLQSHVDQHLSPEQSLEQIAQHFAKICKECFPL